MPIERRGVARPWSVWLVAFLLALSVHRASEPEEPVRPELLEGRVRNVAGEPVAGVEVEFHAYEPADVPDRMAWRPSNDPTQTLKRAREARSRTKTDGQGRFRFHDVAAEGMGTLWLQGSEWVGNTYTHSAVRKPLRLTARAARPLTLALVGPGGAPLAADVVLREEVHAGSGTGDWRRPWSSRGILATDLDGRVRTFVPLDAQVSADVEIPGRWKGTLEVPTQTAGTEIVLRPLSGTGRVHVRVRDEAGRAVAGHEVLAYLTAWPGPGGPVWPLWSDGCICRALTDETGLARIEHAPPGMIRSLIGFGPSCRIPLDDDVPFELDVVAVRPAALHGAVVDERGKPVAGVAIGLRSPGITHGAWLAQANTDAEGTFAIDLVPPGTYQVDAWLRGRYAVLDVADVHDATREKKSGEPPGSVSRRFVSVPQAPGKSLRIRVLEATRLAVRLQDGAGAAILDARVTGRWTPPSALDAPVVLDPWDKHVAHRGADGRFVFEDLPAAGTLEVIVEAAGHAQPTPSRVALTPGTHDRALEFVLDRLQELVGFVVDASGDPVEGAAVCMVAASHETTDGAGRFTFRGSRKHMRPIFLFADPGQRQSVDAGSASPITLRLPSAGLRSLEVLVRGEGGKPVAGLRLALGYGESDQRVTLYQDSDEEGRARFRHVPNTPLRLENASGFGINQPFTVHPGVTTLDVPSAWIDGLGINGKLLDPPVVVHGRVLLPDGTPAPRGRVSVHLDQPRSWIESTDVVGGRFALLRTSRFSRTGPPMSALLATVTEVKDAVGRPLNVLPLMQPLGEITEGGEVVLRLSPGGVIRGDVFDEEGVPIADALVALRAWDPQVHLPAAISARTDSRGRFELLGVPPAPQLGLLVDAPRAFAPSELVAASAGESKEIVLRRWRTLKGRVVDGEGEPWVGMPVDLRMSPSVAARRPPEAALRVVTGSEGEFELACVPPTTAFALVIGHELGARWFPLDRTFERVPADPVTLVLERRHLLRARVRYADGSPVVGAIAETGPWFLDAPSSGHRPSAASDAGGTAEIDDLHGGSHELRIAPRAAPGCSRPPAPWLGRVEVPGPTVDVTFPVPVPDLVIVAGPEGGSPIQRGTFLPVGGAPDEPPARDALDRMAPHRWSVRIGPARGDVLVWFANDTVAHLRSVHARAEPWIAEPQPGHALKVRAERIPPELHRRLGVELRSGDLRVRLDRRDHAWSSPPLPRGRYTVHVTGLEGRLRGRIVAPTEIDPAEGDFAIEYVER